jgi:Acetyltransferase (GNAT) domain
MLRRFDTSQRSTLEQTRSAIRRWIDARAAGGPTFAFALRQPSGLLMGGCEIRLLSPDRAKVSYWIFPEFRNQEYATRVLALLCENVALPLTPDLWPALEDLFGKSGASKLCGTTRRGRTRNSELPPKIRAPTTKVSLTIDR